MKVGAGVGVTVGVKMTDGVRLGPVSEAGTVALAGATVGVAWRAMTTGVGKFSGSGWNAVYTSAQVVSTRYWKPGQSA